MKVGVAAVLVLVGTFAGLTVAGVTPASASTLDGLATLVNPSTSGPVDSGGSATDFTVALAPNGTTPAACDGDTASDGYHVFSYLVPQGTSPTSESFTSGFPSIDYGLVTDSGQYYGKVNTGIGTGQVLSPPNNLQFAELLSKGVTLDTLLYSGGNTSGIWEAGIACANTSGAVTDYWNVQVTFTASGTDPHGFTWTAPAVPAAPNAPTGTSGNASATVDWVAPTDVGSSPITGYVLTPYIGSTAQTAIHLGNVTAHAVTGLTNGTAYTFTVAAINSVGTVLTSPPSSPITPATVPGAPTIGKATAGKGSVALTWTAPSSNGGAAIVHYVITPSHGSAVTVGDVTSDTITGLANGTSYTFKVAATNAAGTGAASAASKAATPDGLYITTKSLPKATKGKKYTAVKLAEKNGVGKVAWSATGLPKGLTVSSAGSLSGTVSSSDAVKTYSVTINVKDSSKPTKQTASTKFSLTVLK